MASAAKGRTLGTRDRKMDSEDFSEALEEFQTKARELGIWYSQELNELEISELKTWFANVILDALAIARQNCVESTPPNARFIKIRSRNMQKQIFLKIEFSCDDMSEIMYDASVLDIRSRLEHEGGYLNYCLEDMTGTFKIAVPVFTGILQHSAG